ncbi:hypothetical protein EVAR_100237_1 [Eumeta japonica]|uniref:Uncharacterized protein n=1 Tax=Eumeta variegata TaxID=151549 RepID=A0A4C1ZWA0_EUMVA|nr:hypothetical protein EVAR_100237_1 [Eumeta japonica]
MIAYVGERDDDETGIGAVTTPIRALQEKLHDEGVRTHRLQHHLDLCTADETIKLCDSTLHGFHPKTVRRISTVHDGTTRQKEKTIYSDDLSIGIGLGPNINGVLNHRVLQICMPGALYSQIIDKIENNKHNEGSTIIVLVGNSLGPFI